MMSQAMSQDECNFFRIAEDYIASRYPFIDLAVRHPITSEAAGVWEVRYELPPHMLGFVPVIGIDRRSCRIVRAEVEQ
jgi:NTF2 fold immunity protein of polymorphic toxin system component